MASDPPASLSVETPAGAPQKRIAVYVVAHNAVQSLARVLERIPTTVRDRVTEIFVFDAGSRDDTYLVGMGYKAVSGYANLTVFRGTDAGLGANNKRAIAYCCEQGYDVMVLLHAHGKYALELRLVNASDGSEVGRGRAPEVEIDNPLRTCEFALQIQNLRFQNPGKYEFQILANDELLAVKTFNVKKAEFQAPGKQPPFTPE